MSGMPTSTPVSNGPTPVVDDRPAATSAESATDAPMPPRVAEAGTAATSPTRVAADAPATAPLRDLARLDHATPADVKSQQWRHRLLVVFADEENDPRLATQRRLLGPVIAELRERDVLLIEVVGDDPLREALGVPRTGFHALLVGKDGGVKLREPQPVRPQTLVALIDAMPMRQAELRQRR